MTRFLRPSVRAMAGYVPGEQPREGEYIKLNTNENPYPPSPRVIEAMEGVLRSDRLRKYPDPVGTAFRQTAGRVLGVDPDCILIGNGSDDILTIVTRAFVPEGGLIVSPTPSYLLYHTLADIQGARFEQVPFTSDWRLPPARSVPHADLMLIPNPNSPTGTFIPIAELEQFVTEWQRPLVIDEAYVDFAEANALRLHELENVIVARTMSKSYSLAGIRFGFGIARADLIRELHKVKDSYNCDVLSLVAATAAIEDQDYLRQTTTKILKTRDRLENTLREFGFQVLSSQANFVWCQRTDWPVKPIYEALKNRRILVRYMNYSGFGDGLRISVGTEDEIDALLSKMKQLL